MNEPKDFHVACTVGRLVEVRCAVLRRAADVRSIERAIADAVKLAGTEAIFCIDWRGITILAPDAADTLIGIMQRGNPRVLRSAALLPRNSILALQVQRIFRDARNPSRRAFDASSDLLSWLGEIATEPECTQMRTFLALAPAIAPARR